MSPPDLEWVHRKKTKQDLGGLPKFPLVTNNPLSLRLFGSKFPNSHPNPKSPPVSSTQPSQRSSKASRSPVLGSATRLHVGDASGGEGRRRDTLTLRAAPAPAEAHTALRPRGPEVRQDAWGNCLLDTFSNFHMIWTQWSQLYVPNSSKLIAFDSFW